MSQPESSGPSLDIRGAIDLSGLARRADTQASPGGGAGTTGGAAAGVVVDVTDATFGQVVQQSTTVPVVVDLWATWCEPCKQLSPILERLAVEYGGRFLLAKVDVDANPQISAAFQVQSIPSVLGIVAGQPVPLFQGAYPEPQVREVIDKLLELAQANGVTGRIEVADQDAPGETVPQEPPLPPLHQEAYDAIERNDLDGAVVAYTKALNENPRDDMARAGLAQVELLRRTQDVDVRAAREAAAADPGDVAAQLLVADLDVVAGAVEDAFARLLDLVRATSGDERETVRLRLLELFEVVGGEDPRVMAARRDLASALY